MKEFKEFDTTPEGLKQTLDAVEEMLKQDGAVLFVGLTIDHRLCAWGWYPFAEEGQCGTILCSVTVAVEQLITCPDPRAKKLLDRLKEQALPPTLFE